MVEVEEPRQGFPVDLIGSLGVNTENVSLTSDNQPQPSNTTINLDCDVQERPICPRCGSPRVFCDGFRKAPLNDSIRKPIQRYRCADYGHRFSRHLPEQFFKMKAANTESSQISVFPQDAKNLAPTQETKTCAEKGEHSPTENEIKAAPQIEKLLTQLRNDGRKPGTVKNYRKSLAHLLREGADLSDPESTKAVLAKSSIKDSTKKTVAAMLDVWFGFNEIKWRAPKYSDEHEIPYIPTEAQLDLLIASLGQKMACFCQLLKETGARCGEIAELTSDMIDFEQHKVRIKAEKGSNSRILSLSQKAIDMIAKLPKNRNPQRKEHLFANADDMRTSFFLQKRRIAERQASKTIMKIHFHTFRHWKATIEQHKTKDPWHVKMILGHKSIKSTETYIHIEKMMYDGEANDQFTVKVADTMDEAIKLMEVGFEYHAEIEGHKLFRKRK
jgi:integrase